MKKRFSSPRFNVAMYLLFEAALIVLIPLANRTIRITFAPGWVLCVLALFCGSGFFAVRLIRTLLEEMQEDARKEVLRAQNAIQKEHLLATMKAEQDMARLQEKLKTMMKDSPQDEMVRRAKIDELLHEEADSLFVNYCPHKIVDALLYHKSLIMKSHGIDYSIVAAVPAELNLDGYAILSVLSNLIDNAIEAVLALDKDRVIDIHLHTRANVLVCQVENTIPAHAALVKGRSTKKDQKQHGLGLAIIEHTCKTHNGLFTHETDGTRSRCTATLCENNG